MQQRRAHPAGAVALGQQCHTTEPRLVEREEGTWFPLLPTPAMLPLSGNWREGEPTDSDLKDQTPYTGRGLGEEEEQMKVTTITIRTSQGHMVFLGQR